MSKKQVIISLIILIVSAISGNAKPTQVLALTGGTNGFGAKYSFNVSRFGFDFGIPLVYIWKNDKNNDTVFTTNIFECNSYLSAKVTMIRQQRYDFDIGVALINTFSFQRNGIKIENDHINSNNGNGFYFYSYVSPIFEYTYKGQNDRKIFGAQLTPIYFSFDRQNVIDVRIGVQLNYFIKRINESPGK